MTHLSACTRVFSQQVQEGPSSSTCKQYQPRLRCSFPGSRPSLYSFLLVSTRTCMAKLWQNDVCLSANRDPRPASLVLLGLLPRLQIVFLPLLRPGAMLLLAQIPPANQAKTIAFKASRETLDKRSSLACCQDASRLLLMIHRV